MKPNHLNCISARSPPQILSLKDECTFRFSNFVVICLCNSSATCRFEIILILIADLSVRVTVLAPEVIMDFDFEVLAPEDFSLK